MKSKVRIWIDEKDIEIKCTNDNIINITGMIGAGKTTTANQYRTDSKYIVISLDCLYRGQDKENMNKETERINQLLSKKFPLQDNEKYFKLYYDEILNYISSVNKPITWVIEGQHIYRYLNFEDLKGTLIVKRTCLINCWKRSIIRHIRKKKILLKKGEITKKQYYHNIWYWIKRRTEQLKYYKKFNQFLEEILNQNVN